MANNVTAAERKNVYEPPQISRRVPFSNRKLSFPSALNPNLLGLPNSSNHENGKDVNAKRRFSNVGDAVSRKLSSTIGWRNVTVLPQEIVLQGRMLCGQYIKQRLKRSGIFSKKSYLSQLRSAIGVSASTAVATETISCLTGAGMELERMYPKLFTSIPRQASMAPGGILVSDKAASSLLVAISHELLKSDINWGKVVSIFAIAGGLAVDCVCQGHPEYIHGVMEGVTEIFEDVLADWVATNGGWSALCAQCRYPEKELVMNTYLSTVLIIIVLLVFTCLVIYFISCRIEHMYR